MGEGKPQAIMDQGRWDWFAFSEAPTLDLPNRMLQYNFNKILNQSYLIFIT